MERAARDDRECRVLDVETPLGKVGLLFEGGILVRIGLPGLGRRRAVFRDFPSLPEGETLARRARKALEAWFRGEEEPLRRLPWEARGTAFQRKVWEAVRRVPRGEVRTYKEISLWAFRSPTRARAVGGALRSNPLPLLVPCHRVLGSSGKLTGFGGKSPAGLALKRKLLAMEGAPCGGG